MYRHIKKYEIKYSDVDAFDNLKLYSLMSFMQESACLSADELGFGYKDVAPYNLGFVLANSCINLNEPIRLGDSVEIHTWPLAPKHLIFIREFEFFVNGKKIGAASTRWCMVDLLTFSIVPAYSHFTKDFFDGYNTERAIDFNCWKIPQITDGEHKYSKTVSFSDYDHYFHVNNAKYADLILDVFSVDELREKRLKSVQITYSKQCKYGEFLQFFRQKVDGHTFLVEGKADGELRVQARIVIDEL